ncbi:PstC2 [Desulforapulum autotrophicum HRM2]|uniref:Phosphate transport system permease protein n=1 Tax=Desulforapulum autotrophicum (strain ATCC 43914 / DSM 3382 / VKM B-1955 / HRM2) TaxID=177437 RepID=C0QFH3_DESAH|nr:phosphate ABC transporter permease subunit PstC [Desulforapulum autotrophicum]ACN13369.1 PstC2 [Desulforapulum autotrophicum HRM2]
MPKQQTSEKIVQRAFMGVALFSITALFLIMLFLVLEGVPIFKEISLKEFVFGLYWYPTSDPADFGIFPLIVASFLVTFLSGVVSIPLGVMTAIYLAEIAPVRTAEIVKPVVELMASMPSVVIGFFGMVVVAPFIQRTFDIPVGLNLFNASLMLAFMSIPTICSISEDAIFSVPQALKEASFALGATHFETIHRVTLPASLSGICTAVILGMSRAIGETMVVLMVAGGAAMLPGSLFDPVRPMPASIAAEMAEAPFGSEHYHALFATGLVLFIFTFVFNLIADYISSRYRQVGEASL